MDWIQIGIAENIAILKHAHCVDKLLVAWKYHH